MYGLVILKPWSIHHTTPGNSIITPPHKETQVVEFVVLGFWGFGGGGGDDFGVLGFDLVST